MTVGVDVGGTFTDLAWWDGTGVRVAKTSSTPDQSVGVADGTGAILEGSTVPMLLHGTTVATNALLERAGARTVLVTDAGYEDLIEIGRQNRPSLYDPFADRARPLADREWRIGYPADAPLAARIRRLEPDAIAVSLLRSYADPGVERDVVASLEDLGVPISPSHEVVGEFREFERANTTLVNAYLRPKVERYLERLQEVVVPRLAGRLLVMRSSGGLVPTSRAAHLAASILLSGPAGGVVAAAALGDALGRSRVISFDMGGTSTDVCRIEGGRPELTYEREIDGQVVRMPSVAVHTVGAGGGSIGWLDPGGALRVGPRSAGANPGPASYGRGGVEPTVTDANLALGRIDGMLADGLLLDADAATRALRAVGERSGLDPVGVARGILEVVEATMERAIRAVSVEEGADPRPAVLVAFGGAGGLHASAIARRLEMAGVVVPPYAGVFSALGLLLSPPRHDEARSVLLDKSGADRLDPALREIAARAEAVLAGATGIDPETLDTRVDVRYVGQSHETSVSYRPGEGWDVLARRFHQVHEDRNGFSRPGDPIEAVTVRAIALGTPSLRWEDLPPHRPTGEPERGSRPVMTADGQADATVWWRPAIRPGREVAGPAVVEEGESTTWIGPGERAVLDESGALSIEW
jgi:N-methylhydantoinase A